MWGYALSVVGLAALCGSWVVFQRWIARHDPGSPGVEGNCGRCGVPDCETIPGHSHQVDPKRGA